jgi:nucleotide-binding universal stress UspA family protein
LGGGFSRRARDLIMQDHSRSDTHLDRILSPTIFSTQTNRRIFRGMVHVLDSESWQRIFQIASDASRWDLSDPDIARYMERSYDFVMDFLNRVEKSEPYELDPSGDESLKLAADVRREARASGLAFRLAEESVRRFTMPDSSLRFAAELRAPLYPPPRDTRDASN